MFFASSINIWENVAKLFLSILSVFRKYFIFLAPEYWYSFSKHQVCFNKKFWKPAFGTQTPIFFFIFPDVRPIFPTSNHYFEGPTNISNVQPILRRSSKYFERPANMSNVQPVFWPFSPLFLDKMNFEKSSVITQEKQLRSIFQGDVEKWKIWTSQGVLRISGKHENRGTQKFRTIAISRKNGTFENVAAHS